MRQFIITGAIIKPRADVNDRGGSTDSNNATWTLAADAAASCIQWITKRSRVGGCTAAKPRAPADDSYRQFGLGLSMTPTCIIQRQRRRSFPSQAAIFASVGINLKTVNNF